MDHIENPADPRDAFVELRFKPGTWAAKGFPENGCWIRTSTFARIIDEGGKLEIEDVIADLMDWLSIAPDRAEILMTLSLIAHRHAAKLCQSHSD